MKIFVPKGCAVTGGLDIGGRCEFTEIGHREQSDGGITWVQDGYTYTCPNGFSYTLHK